LSLITGTAKYENIVSEGSLEDLLQKCDLDREFKIMSEFPEFMQDLSSTENMEGKEGIKYMLELFQYSQQLSVIPEVCKQYGLTQCLEDERLVMLEEIANSVKSREGKAKITGKDAFKYMEQIWQALNCDDKHKVKRCLKIFPAVADCAEFYRFIKGKGYTGDERNSSFKSKVELIAAQLQHEDYSEIVLHHLKPAFQYIRPFLNTNQNFTELMNKIFELFKEGTGFGHDAQNDFCQLETANSNVTLIQLWFSRTEVRIKYNVQITYYVSLIIGIVAYGMYMLTI